MTHEPGQQLLHYRLVEKIGQGGMGTVWRARDSSLGRDAAIKILPAELADDAQFLSRFEREAKLLASLSHPNLATVFGVHASDGTRFLAMELVPGEDLAVRLERGPLPLDEAIGILMRIADAVEAAHAKGVIHRDLKPANIRLTPAGGAKVLDFGLAKALEGDPSSHSSTDPAANPGLTATGVAMGTAPYMSPEQVRGRAVDARADIWAFGCVLWECLTGARLFDGETRADIAVAILNDEPDWTCLPKRTPPALRRLLRRCLAKHLRERLHHIADARIELEQAAAELASATSGAQPAAAASPNPRVVVPLVAAAVATALVVALFLFLSGGGEPPLLFEHVNPRKLTNWPGDESDAAVSPDGQWVAFLSDRPGSLHAFVGRIEGGAFTDLGPATPQQVRSPRCLGFLDDSGGIWLTGKAGTPEWPMRKLDLQGNRLGNMLPPGTIHVDWSPDGQRIVYSHWNHGDPLWIADPNGANPRELKLPTYDGFHQHYPTWSRPDGRWIYVTRGRNINGEIALWRVRPDGTELQQLTGDDLREVTYPVPIDERTVLFCAKKADGSGPWIWELDVETRTPRRAVRGVEHYTALSASRDRRRFVATVSNPRVGLWTVPILPPGEEATKSVVKSHPLPAVRALAPRLRNDRLFYLSSNGGADGLWRWREGEPPEVIWPGSLAPLVAPCAIAPDGNRVAFVVQESERTRLYVTNVDGTEPQTRMDDVQVVGAPCWSPDGAWIAAGGARDGRKGLFRVPAEGGRAECVKGDIEAVNPVWSPDGRMIVFAGPQSGPTQVLHAVTLEPLGGPVDGFPGDLAVPVLGERVRFLPDGSGFAYLQGTDPDYDFHIWDLKSNSSRRLTALAGSNRIRTFDVTPDGKTIVFDRLVDNSDTVLFDLDESD